MSFRVRPWEWFGAVPEVSADLLKSWLEEGRPVQLVDARTASEYCGGTISAARHAPLTQIPGSLERLGLDASLPVVALCLSGHRSRPLVRWLRSHQFEAYSLSGGVGTWRLKGYPVQPPMDCA